MTPPMSKPDRHPLLALAFGLAVLAPARGARAQEVDPYEDALARAAALEVEGRFDEAARFLESGLAYYAQDPTLPIRIAALHRRAGHLDASERFYWMALARSAASVDARLGLAEVLEAEGRCAEALPFYRDLAAELPDLPGPAAGAARCTPAPSVRVTASVALGGTWYQDHPYRFLAGSMTPGLAISLRSGWTFGATYRYTRFVPPSASGLSASDQHEGYLSAGWGAPLGGITFHYGIVADGSGQLGTSHHAGLTARWSPFGDIEVRASGSFYDDMKILRVEPSWRIPLVRGLSIRPGVGLADAGGELLATGMATLALDRPSFSLWAGGKYGDEVRPVYFSVPVVYDVPERIPFGAWAGAAVNASDDVRIHLTYAMDRLKQGDGTATSAHSLAIGAALSF